MASQRNAGVGRIGLGTVAEHTVPSCSECGHLVAGLCPVSSGVGAPCSLLSVRESSLSRPPVESRRDCRRSPQSSLGVGLYPVARRVWNVAEGRPDWNAAGPRGVAECFAVVSRSQTSDDGLMMLEEMLMMVLECAMSSLRRCSLRRRREWRRGKCRCANLPRVSFSLPS